MKKSIPKKEQEMTPELKQINSEKTELNKILSENLGILKKRLQILNNADFTADTNKAILELGDIIFGLSAVGFIVAVKVIPFDWEPTFRFHAPIPFAASAPVLLILGSKRMPISFDRTALPDSVIFCMAVALPTG